MTLRSPCKITTFREPRDVLWPTIVPQDWRGTKRKKGRIPNEFVVRFLRGPGGVGEAVIVQSPHQPDA